MRLHHVQVACPRGGEDDARRFWVEGLGMAEVAKPAELAGRGGCWFRAGSAEMGAEMGAEIHVGVEEPFAPARKAHPALVVDDLEGTAARLDALGFEVDWRERHTFAGFERAHAFDAHGNRVELLAQLA